MTSLTKIFYILLKLSYRVRNREAKITKQSDQLFNHQNNELITEIQIKKNEKIENLNQDIIRENPNENIPFVIEGADEVPNFIRADVQTDGNNEISNQIDLIIEECTEEYKNDGNAMDLEDNLTKLKLFNSLYDNCHEVILPNSLWGLHRCPKRSAFCFSYMNVTQMKITKIVTITMDGGIQIYANTFLINNLQLANDVYDLNDLSILLNQVDLWRFCNGQSSNENCEIVVESNNENTCKSNESELLTFCRVCKRIS